MLNLLVRISTETKISTVDQPCIREPSYNFFRCVESYFFKERRCQFPWNEDEKLELRTCSDYSEIYSIPYMFEKSYGYKRQTWSQYERLIKTNYACLIPCFSKHYNVKVETWKYDVVPEEQKVSLQLTFEDFVISHKEEYIGCDSTCILGEIGGYLGFFLGGSVLLGIDMILRFIENIHRRFDKSME